MDTEVTVPPRARRSLVERMRGAALLDIATYEEVEADTTATGQAAIAVAIVAVATAIGMAGRGGPGLIAAPIAALLSWLIWAGVTYLIGAKVLGGTATWGELLRTLGFAQAPGVLMALAIVPFLGRIVMFAVSLWLLVTGIVAIRQALDVSTGKAVVTALLAFLVLVVVQSVLGVGMVGRRYF